MKTAENQHAKKHGLTSRFDEQRGWCAVDGAGHVVMEGLPHEPSDEDMARYARAQDAYDKHMAPA